MRTFFAPLLLGPLALAAPDILAPFEPALPQLPTPQDNSTALEHGSGPDMELLRRQNTNACATSYYACAALNAPGLCCPRTALCTADQRGAVACCPQGAQCTGALGQPLQTAASPTFVLATATPTITTGNNPFVQATAGPRSTVPNQFYPFFYIPTTYQNAGACSSAYSTCQSDAASCTTALANGAQGVTVSAPNGGATITAVPSVGLASAQSICASLSQAACSGLQVEACAAFGGAAGAAATGYGRCGGYLMGAGVAVGLAGQMLR